MSETHRRPTQTEENTMSITTISYAATALTLNTIRRVDLRLLGLIGAVTAAATTVGLNG
jgi:hypothetical protein